MAAPSRNNDRNHPAQMGMRSVLAGIGLNVILAGGKLAAGLAGNSYALVADAIESSTDIVSSLVLYFGLRVASRAPDSNHPYGHGKAEPMAAAVVALSLGMAAVLITIQSIENIRTPHHSPAPFTLIVLAGVILLKEGMFRYVIKVGEEIHSQAVKTDAWHHRSDAISSMAAFIGIGIGVLGGDDYAVADDYAALVAAILIAYNGYTLLMPALWEMMDTAPPLHMTEDIANIARQVDGVMEVEKCIVRKMGFEYFVDLHIEVDGNLTVDQGHNIAHRVKDAILAADDRIYDVLTHVEPYRSMTNDQ